MKKEKSGAISTFFIKKPGRENMMMRTLGNDDTMMKNDAKQ